MTRVCAFRLMGGCKPLLEAAGMVMSSPGGKPSTRSAGMDDRGCLHGRRDCDGRISPVPSAGFVRAGSPSNPAGCRLVIDRRSRHRGRKGGILYYRRFDRWVQVPFGRIFPVRGDTKARMRAEPRPARGRAGDDHSPAGVFHPDGGRGRREARRPGTGSFRPGSPRSVPGPAGPDPTDTSPSPVGGQSRAGTTAGPDERSGRVGHAG